MGAKVRPEGAAAGKASRWSVYQVVWCLAVLAVSAGCVVSLLPDWETNMLSFLPYVLLLLALLQRDYAKPVLLVVLCASVFAGLTGKYNDAAPLPVGLVVVSPSPVR